MLNVLVDRGHRAAIASFTDWLRVFFSPEQARGSLDGQFEFKRFSFSLMPSFFSFNFA
ncbi:hypothetical protein P7H19_21780 [Paenibacillus larvae]|nr:hypothetical protein [Paenibacillus larvae]MDT2238384.1 hypothetical protein [Paenibacillus larvae]